LDIMDGDNARFHPHLMRPATAEEANDLRIGIGIYQDGIEPCNPLGHARGKHKVVCYYYNVANLPARLRNSLTHLQLITVVKASTQKTVGAARVLSGVSSDGVVHSEDTHCFAAQMKQLADGVSIVLPNDKYEEVDLHPLASLCIHCCLFTVLCAQPNERERSQTNHGSFACLDD